MVFCTNCGTSLPAGAKFCPSCGTAVAAPAQAPVRGESPPPPTPPRNNTVAAAAEAAGGPSTSELRGVTAAVRSYSANAPQAEKEKKYGQQKWGLFETDYQRRKGITTEQSLQEIEQFCEGGGEVCAPHPTAKPGQGPFGGTASPASASASTGPQSPRRFGPGAGGPGAGGPGAAAGGPGAARGATSSGVGGSGSSIKFGPSGDAGADFFAQHQAREAAKYKPGYRGPK